MPHLRKVTVALLAVGADQSAADDELDGGASVRYCETADRLLSLVERGGVDVVVTQLRDSSGESIVGAVASFHRRYPELPIVGFIAMKPATLHDVPDALDAGVTEWSVRAHDRLGTVVRLAIRRGWHPSAARPLAAALRSLLPDDLHEFAVACAIKASHRLTAERMAEWIRTSERTLRARLQRLGLKPPSEFIEYGTVVHAAYLLDHLGVEAGEVARDLGFIDRRALNRLLRTYTGQSARSFREHADVASILAVANRVLQRETALLSADMDVTMGVIDRYLSGKLSPEQQVEVEKQLVARPELAEYVAEIRRLLASAAAPEDLQRQKRDVWSRLRRHLG